jgi:hypothetical protein
LIPDKIKTNINVNINYNSFDYVNKQDLINQNSGVKKIFAAADSRN